MPKQCVQRYKGKKELANAGLQTAWQVGLKIRLPLVTENRQTVRLWLEWG